MTPTLLLIVLSTVLTVLIVAVPHTLSLVYGAIFFWLPMFNSVLVYRLVRKTRMPMPEIAGLAFSALIAPRVIDVVAPTFFGVVFLDSWLYGLILGPAAVTGDVLKNYARKYWKIPKDEEWVPYDQAAYVVFGSAAVTLINVFRYHAHLGTDTAFTFFMQLILAIAAQALFLYLAPLVEWKPRK